MTGPLTELERLRVDLLAERTRTAGLRLQLAEVRGELDAVRALLRAKQSPSGRRWDRFLARWNLGDWRVQWSDGEGGWRTIQLPIQLTNDLDER